MSEIQKLNKTFDENQILLSDEMNAITNKIDEVIEETNSPTNTPKGGYNRALFEAAGAVYNEETGFYELNGLTDITKEEMTDIYENGRLYKTFNWGRTFIGSTLRTIIPLPYEATNNVYNISDMFNRNKYIEVVYLCKTPLSISNIHNAFNGCNNLKSILGVLFLNPINAAITPFLYCYKLETLNINSLKFSVSFKDSPLLFKESILYMIKNSVATSPITITLHTDAYAMAMADEDIQAALTKKTNVSLATV